MTLKIPARPADGHKGTFGSLAIIGGQIGEDKVMLGSATFAAKAALRSGVGLVYFAGQKEVLVELIKIVPQALGQKLNAVKNCEAVVIGPGLGQSESSALILKKVLDTRLPTVIDADGLNILTKETELLSLVHSKCVLTPHPGEFTRLSEAAGVETAEDLAKKLRCCIVAKDFQTNVTNGKQNWLNEQSNPALATGGTGDVLSGLIGGLLAQYFPGQLTTFECACLGVQIHSQAGLNWSKKHGPRGLFIEELVDLIPKAIQNLEH